MRRTAMKLPVGIRLLVSATIALSLTGCGQLIEALSEDEYEYEGDFPEDRSLSQDAQEVQDALDRWNDSQDDFYHALEEDRQTYIREKVGELGLSLADPEVQELLQPMSRADYEALIDMDDERVSTFIADVTQEAPIEAPETRWWWRESLTDEGKQLYDQWVGYLQEGYQDFHLDVCYRENQELYHDVWRAIRYDRPELFWIIQYDKSEYSVTSYSDPAYGTDIHHNFLCPAEEIPQHAAEIDAVIREFHDYVGSDTSPEHVTARAAVWLADRLTYDYDFGPNNQTTISSLLSDRTVCAGYGRAYQMLLWSYGIPCFSVVGYVGDDVDNPDSFHLWNNVWLDGQWSSVDVTWMDNEPVWDWRYLMFSKDTNEQRNMIPPHSGPQNLPETVSIPSVRDYAKTLV